MGCSESKQCTVFLCWEGIAMGKKVYGSRSITTTEYEIDLTSFSQPKRILGIGGFGMVRAVTKLTGSDKNTAYALKSLSKSAVLQRSSGTAAVLSELKALALLVDAKFICNVHYAFQDSIFLYMIIDLAAGGDLRFALKFSPSCRFNEVRARFYTAQIILAVDSCHAASILHRDIKPENILLQANGYLLLSDFGVAKILPDVEDCRSTSGTHGYMAPEIYLPHHRHGTAADWFALGVTLHEFVTGRRPFETSKLQAFRNGETNAGLLSLAFLESCNYISESCKDFIAGLLVPKPSRRLGSYRGIEEMKQHSWLGGFEWDKLLTQSLTAPYKPDTSFDRTDVKGENMRKAVHDHINSKPIPSSDQFHFQSYEYRRRYYTCGEYESSYHQTKATVSVNTSPAASTAGAGSASNNCLSSERTGCLIRQSNLPIRAIQSPINAFTSPPGDGRQPAHFRQKVTYGVGSAAPVTAEVSTRDNRQSQMTWTLKSSLVHENNIPNASKSGGSYQQEYRQQEDQKSTDSRQKGDRYREISKFTGVGAAGSKTRDRIWLQGSKSDDEHKSVKENSSIDSFQTESVKSAIATGSTNTGSAASIKFMANHVRAMGSKNYVRQQQQDGRAEGKLNYSMQSDEIALQLNTSGRSQPLTSTTSKSKVSDVVKNYEGKASLHSIGFKSQKDKRQKLDLIPVNLDLPSGKNEISSCLISPKAARIESIYTRHQQQTSSRPPQIQTRKSQPEVTNSSAVPAIMEMGNAVATASAGVRMFHGLSSVPNISDEEGDAADWIGHAMSSTSQPVEVSVESSRGNKDSNRKGNENFGNVSPNSADASDYAVRGSKWGGEYVDESDSTMQTARGSSRQTTEMPHDSAVSYRDQVFVSEVRNRNPSHMINSLASRNECCSKLKEIIKNTAAVRNPDWPSDQKRQGPRLSGKNDGWNSDSQDGDNASVSIVSPDATDNRELALPESSI